MSEFANQQTGLMNRESVFESLYMEINNALNNESVKTECVEKIHPEINCYYNSVNVFVGKQGAWKPFLALTEIIKISKVDPTPKGLTHLL